MIPLHLFISGFLSYRDPVEIDFSSIAVACISGPNGSGKSSLLDAMTWALFGQARRKDDALINAHSAVAEVRLAFGYEGNLYRVLRSKPRDKVTLLEFHLCQLPADGFEPGLLTQAGAWKPLTERTLRETEALIEHTLRLDYETFVNASFFLQGKADQFTQQRPGDRKRILSSILGLDIWDRYRERAADRRKSVDAQLGILAGRLDEIDVELAEEDQRRARLKELDKELERLSVARKAQEAVLENLRKVAAALVEQGKLVDMLARQADVAVQRLAELEAKLAARQSECQAYGLVVARADQIETDFLAWQAARQRLERWEEIAGRFREHEKRRQGPLDTINAARARLEQDCQHLEGQRSEIEAGQPQMEALQAELASLRGMVDEAEQRIAQRLLLDFELQAARKRLAEARAENPLLRAGMDELKSRIDQLSQSDGAACPLCGQPLAQSERLALVETLAAEGKEMGTRYRENKTLLDQADALVHGLEGQLQELGEVEIQRMAHMDSMALLSARLEALESQRRAWETQQGPRLAEIRASLEQETFAPQAFAELAWVDAELKAIGYDAAAHDADRRAEAFGRQAEADMRALEQARAALAPLERGIADLQQEIGARQAEATRQQAEHQSAAQALAEAQAQTPDLYAAEDQLAILQTQENDLRMQVGAASQKVLVLDTLKARRLALDAESETLRIQAAQFRQLEKAFGKDGVPALLIEQALPQIEAKANEILDRLSQGNMSVRFITQAAFKDKRREDLKETLDIHISDGVGVRDYEMFSGGEAFRLNFALRLALSEVLAQRAGARLQTLVIDEGFGSQDTMGRQRLIEAINLVRPDFAKILVITHIDELKDAFPVRIEVEKTDRGSQVQVM